MLKLWKVCKSRKFRPSINLQPRKKNWKKFPVSWFWLWSFGELPSCSTSSHLRQGSEVAGGLCPLREGQWHGRGSWGGRTPVWVMEKHGVTKDYLLLRKMLSSVDGTQKQWAGTRSNGWVRGKTKGNRELFQLETGWNAGRRGIILPISLKTLHAEVCSIWVTISTAVGRNTQILP